MYYIMLYWYVTSPTDHCLAKIFLFTVVWSNYTTQFDSQLPSQLFTQATRRGYRVIINDCNVYNYKFTVYLIYIYNSLIFISD